MTNFILATLSLIALLLFINLNMVNVNGMPQSSNSLLLNGLNAFSKYLHFDSFSGEVEPIIASGNIIIQNGVINCDLILCPLNSFQCTITKKSINKNNTLVRTIKECTAENGTLLLSNSTIQSNQMPGQYVSSYKSINLNGTINSCQLCNVLPETAPNVTDATWMQTLKQLKVKLSSAEVLNVTNTIQNIAEAATITNFLDGI